MPRRFDRSPHSSAFDPNDPVCRAGDGRGGSPLPPCFNTGRGIRVFSQYAAVGESGSVPTPEFDSRLLISHSPQGPAWVILSAFAVEVERVAANPVSQLNPSQIETQGRQSSRLRWRIEWGGAGGGQVREADIAEGGMCSVYVCSSVSVYALVPVNNHVGTTDQTFDGRVLDTSLGAELIESRRDGPVGSQRLRLTDTVVQSGARQLIPVPPGALTVELSATAAVTLDWDVGGANVDGTPSTVSRVVLPASLNIEVQVPGTARFLAVPAGANTVTAVWRLDV